jgi:hypothetical protein
MLALAQRRNPANSAPAIATRQRRALRRAKSSAGARDHSSLPHQILLTVKLRGRTTTPDRRRGRTIFSRARGAKQEALHGPLQRLLGVILALSRLPEASVDEFLWWCIFVHGDVVSNEHWRNVNTPIATWNSNLAIACASWCLVKNANCGPCPLYNRCGAKLAPMVPAIEIHGILHEALKRP